MFLQIVDALKLALGVPESVPASQAVNDMSTMMGFSTVDNEGHAISLPAQVQRLVEATGIETSAEPIREEANVAVQSGPVVAPTSVPSAPLRQSKAHPESPICSSCVRNDL